MSWVMWYSLHSLYEPWDVREVRAKAQQPWIRAESWAWLSSCHEKIFSDDFLWKVWTVRLIVAQQRLIISHAKFHALQNQWAIRVWPQTQRKWKHLELSWQGSETVQTFCMTTRRLPWDVVKHCRIFQYVTAESTLGCVQSVKSKVTARLVIFFGFNCHNLWKATMSLVDSNAVFESRALAIGISQDTVNALGLRGWVTHATFAFSVATNPGTGDDQPFIDGVLIPILGREDHVDAPKLRRLFYESHTLTAADLRRKVDANE